MFVLASALLASCRAATSERGAVAAELPTVAPVDVVRVLPAPDYERPLGEPVEMSPIEVAKTGGGSRRVWGLARHRNTRTCSEAVARGCRTTS